MDKYIELDQLIKRLEVTPILKYGIPAQVRDGVIDLVKKQPAADVAPVVHGRWIEHIDDYENYCECSVCHGVPDSPLDTTPFCPNCGARMGGE